MALGAACWAAPVAAQTATGDMAPVDCLPEPEQVRFAKELEVLIKKEAGISDVSQLMSVIGPPMAEALDKRGKAEACVQAAGGNAAQRCASETAAADQAEKRFEELSARMEKLEQSMLALRARYRRC